MGLGGEGPMYLALFVGPGGGFTEQEIAQAVSRGAVTVSLGPRILRTETAGPVLAALALYEAGDLDPEPEAPVRMTRPIFLLTDFGTADTYLGIVKAVILGIAPNTRIVDLTHEIPPQDVRAGAFALLTGCSPRIPASRCRGLGGRGPRVGTDRRPIAVQVDSRTFGPGQRSALVGRD